MTIASTPAAVENVPYPLSLYHLIDPDVLANPYPLYRRLRTEDPVHWDPFLHAWIVTRYGDVLTVLQGYSAARTPTPERLNTMGLSQLKPIAQVMVKQLIFMDPPAHTRLRNLAAQAFTPSRIEATKTHIREIANRLLEGMTGHRTMDVIAVLAAPLPCAVSTEMLGLPFEDSLRLRAWSLDFAQMLGNFQHNPDHVPKLLKTVDEMAAYFQSAIKKQRKRPSGGVFGSLLNASIEGDRLSEEEIVANSILIMVASQETTTNLIGNAVLTLLRHPAQLERLRHNQSLIPSAIEEVLRYESPSHLTARLAPGDATLNGKHITEHEAVIAVIGAANRDPERFPEPDQFDITRQDNRHLAFGWGTHFCFGAALARMEGQIALESIMRLPRFVLGAEKLVWRNNQGLRGLKSLPVTFHT
jgi:cytochrome P450